MNSMNICKSYSIYQKQSQTYKETHIYTMYEGRHNSVAGHLPSLCKVIDTTLNTAKIKQSTHFQFNNSMTIQFNNSRGWEE